jgi:hypothetical protein
MKLSTLSSVLMCLMRYGVDARVSYSKDGWVDVSPNVAFQRHAEVSLGSPAIDAAIDEAISRMLASSSANPSYMYQSIDSSASYDEFQLAWRLLGFYTDCNATNSYGAGCNRQVLYAVVSFIV